MRRAAIAVPSVVGAFAVCVLVHSALIEVVRKVIVIRTENSAGDWLETRLWIVDDQRGSWLHGGDSAWVRNLRERPIVELDRVGPSRRHRARVVPGPHPQTLALLRAKYGVADVWVRLVGPDDESAAPVALERPSER